MSTQRLSLNQHIESLDSAANQLKTTNIKLQQHKVTPLNRGSLIEAFGWIILSVGLLILGLQCGGKIDWKGAIPFSAAAIGVGALIVVVGDRISISLRKKEEEIQKELDDLVASYQDLVKAARSAMGKENAAKRAQVIEQLNTLRTEIVERFESQNSVENRVLYQEIHEKTQALKELESQINNLSNISLSTEADRASAKTAMDNILSKISTIHGELKELIIRRELLEQLNQDCSETEDLRDRCQEHARDIRNQGSKSGLIAGMIPTFTTYATDLRNIMTQQKALYNYIMTQQEALPNNPNKTIAQLRQEKAQLATQFSTKQTEAQELEAKKTRLWRIHVTEWEQRNAIKTKGEEIVTEGNALITEAGRLGAAYNELAQIGRNLAEKGGQIIALRTAEHALEPYQGKLQEVVQMRTAAISTRRIITERAQQIAEIVRDGNALVAEAGRLGAAYNELAVIGRNMIAKSEAIRALSTSENSRTILQEVEQMRTTAISTRTRIEGAERQRIEEETRRKQLADFVRQGQEAMQAETQRLANPNALREDAMAPRRLAEATPAARLQAIADLHEATKEYKAKKTIRETAQVELDQIIARGRAVLRANKAHAQAQLNDQAREAERKTIGYRLKQALHLNERDPVLDTQAAIANTETEARRARTNLGKKAFNEYYNPAKQKLDAAKRDEAEAKERVNVAKAKLARLRQVT